MAYTTACTTVQAVIASFQPEPPPFGSNHPTPGLTRSVTKPNAPWGSWNSLLVHWVHQRLLRPGTRSAASTVLCVGGNTNIAGTLKVDAEEEKRCQSWCSIDALLGSSRVAPCHDINADQFHQYSDGKGRITSLCSFILWLSAPEQILFKLPFLHTDVSTEQHQRT